jgi:hypothetical protein
MSGRARLFCVVPLRQLRMGLRLSAHLRSGKYRFQKSATDPKRFVLLVSRIYPATRTSDVVYALRAAILTQLVLGTPVFLILRARFELAAIIPDDPAPSERQRTGNRRPYRGPKPAAITQFSL